VSESQRDQVAGHAMPPNATVSQKSLVSQVSSRKLGIILSSTWGIILEGHINVALCRRSRDGEKQGAKKGRREDHRL
jgi:hypothetical protein